ncbi:hypothetical protein LCGC14_0129740 [marine sediment metagenome]|uniref:YHYH domain-containing protein n=1 Tax=marine sediment metagenome TaxID=412755 RepID=A0A0F9VK24_9ZZZZ|nr:YHYH protein [Maribacter sp.]HDZ06059.1 YHYH protein [Maribacter sp.]HEA79344.1 YHYH protein [Maribacter sp.]
MKKEEIFSNKYLLIFSVVALSCIAFLACSNNESDDTEVALSEDDLAVNATIQESFFNTSSLLSYSKVDCTLEDGTSGDCYKLVFSSNPVEDGPYCPKTIDDIGGLGIYDGNTNPGFQVLKADLFNAMEADGYDIINIDGTINTDDFNSGPVDSSFSYCLEAAPDNTLQLSFLIPATPKLSTSNNNIDTIELVGVSLDGAPINGNPPSVTNPGREIAGNIPSLDPCGGHNDPAGYYHLHFVSQTMNQVLAANNITDVSCTLVEQVSGTELIGFAKDGFPIYAYEIEPDDLDDCGGRTDVTKDFPDGIYHYVASNTDAPNVPKCLKGVAATNNFQIQ